MNLDELGFTKNEIKVFTSLLKFEKLGAAEISRESEVSYGRIYDVLASLEQKGLVRILPGKKKLFVASNPQVLSDLIKKKQERLRNLDRDVSELKKIYSDEVKEPILVAKGKNNFYKLLKELKNAEIKEYNIKYNLEYKFDWAKSVKNKLSNGVVVRNLVRLSVETEKNFKKWEKVNPEMKFFENEGVVMSLRDNEEVLFSLINSNVSFLVKDRAFCSFLGKVFDFYYENN